MSQSEQFLRQFTMHRTVLPDILTRVPDDQFDLKPWPSALSLSELALHMVTSADWFVTSVQNGKFGSPEKETATSAEEVRRLVDEYTKSTSEKILALTDEQMDSIVEAKHIFRFDAPGKVFLHSMRDHEIHHKGQMFVYARLAGVQEMPFFLNMG